MAEATERPLWHCPDCDRPFANVNQSHSCVRVPVERHFEGRDPTVRGLFDALVAAARERGPVKVVASEARVGLQVRMIFAAVTPQRHTLRGHLVLARRVDDPRFVRVDSVSARNHVHHFRLTHAGEIDARFRELLAESYAVGCQEHLYRTM